MIRTITKNQFHDEFNSIRPNNFSYHGLNALYDYLVELEESCDMQIELDVIALCCDFSEDEIEYFLEQYDLENIEQLEQNTIVIRVKNSSTIIIQNY